ncbi:MAG TPA: EAL domain-containing protein [Marinagarivorans sp.]
MPALASHAAPALSQYVMDVWSTRDGLPEGAILSIHEDDNGWLWLGTECCLVRFDGTQFYNQENALSHLGQYSFIRSLSSDGGNGFWAGFAGGVLHYDGERYHRYGAQHGLTHPFVYALSGDDSPWIGTGGDGIWRFIDGRFKRDSGFAKPLSGKINDLKATANGALWGATDNGVVLRPPGGQTWQPLPLPSKAFNGVINELAIGDNNSIWIASQQGLARYSSGDGLSPVTALAGTPIYALLVDHDGAVWAGSQGAIYRINKDGNVETLSRISSGKVSVISRDKNGNIWAGTESSLLRFKTGAFKTYGQAEGLPDNDILAIFARPSGGLWLLDSLGGLGQFNDGLYTEALPAGTILGTGMLGLTETEDGALWISNGVLRRFYQGEQRTFPVPSGGATLVEPAQDGLWVAQTHANGSSHLLRLPAKLEQPQGDAIQISATDFTAIPLTVSMRHIQRLYTDRNHHLWLATGGTGLIHLNPRGELIKHWTQADGLPSDIVYGMTEDTDGGLWIATRGGIAWLQDNRLSVFEQTAGAPTAAPVHIFLDAQDRFWITGDDGIHLIHRQAFIDAAQTPSQQIFKRKLGTQDGMRSRVISWRRGGQAITADGILSYATASGLSQVEPSSVTAELPSPRVTINSVHVNDTEHSAPALTIKDRQAHIGIAYTAPDLNAARKLEFRTRLAPHGHRGNASWSPATQSRTAQFSNLAYGQYAFEVAVRYAGQPWSPQIASLRLNVPPRFYERSLFQLAALIMAIGASLMWGRVRLRRAKRAEIVLRKRVAERTTALSQEIEVRKAAEACATDLARNLEERVRERTAELELAELAVRRSEARFALAAQGAEDGIWDWDISLNILYLSPRWQAILGYDEHQFPATVNAWLEAVHPCDVGYLRDLLVYSPNDDHFRYEYRIRHKNNHYIWVLTRGVVLRDSAGTPTRAAGSQTDISARKIAEAKLAKSQTEDPVTGLPNRVLFADRLNQALLRGRQQKSLVAVLHVDIDHFRAVNENHGHAAGDDVLREFAARLSATLRSTDSIARVGNDEFAILMTEITTTQEANLTAERLRNALKTPLIINGNPVPITCSIGIKVGHPGEATEQSLLVESELAVAQAKSAGGARLSVFDDKLNAEARARKQLEAELQQGLEQAEFVLHYQPLICAKTGDIAGVEALARWQHPERGLLSPYHFIGMLEACGLIVPFSDWVLKTACAQAREWQKTLPSPVRISINLPAHQLNEVTLYNDIHAALAQTQTPAKLLGIEIVETSVLETRPDIIQNLRRLRADGVQIAIDDFGTGYSAFSYLNKLPIDHIKIDRSFCQRLPDDPKATSIFTALLDMIAQLGMEPVVEGVETEAQYRFICTKGTPIIQGYLFSKPLDVASCTEYLKNNTQKSHPLLSAKH